MNAMMIVQRLIALIMLFFVTTVILKPSPSSNIFYDLIWEIIGYWIVYKAIKVWKFED